MYKEKRIQEFEEMSLGLFVHWGLYSLLEEGEWTEEINKIPPKKYEKLISHFTAEEFSAKQLVLAAKEMGAKYITLTTKHHEGFYLYDTKGLSTFDVMHSPAHRDLIKEFTNACHEENIKPFLYMATYDWHDSDFENNFDRYLKHLNQAIKILCTNYGEIGGFWFDGNWEKPNANWKLDELYKIIRTYQPNAMIINNTGLENRGKLINPEIDAVTYEQSVADNNTVGNKNDKYVAKESSMTINDHWGWARDDLNYKTVAQIIEKICQAKNLKSNFLLNIGLTGSGSIPQIFKDYLHAIGIWISKNKVAYYHGNPTNITSKSNKKDFVLIENNKLYIFLHDLGVVGDENVILTGSNTNPRSFINLYHKIESVHWIDDNEPLSFMQDLKEGIFTINAKGNRYGRNLIVRIACAIISK